MKISVAKKIVIAALVLGPAAWGRSTDKELVLVYDCSSSELNTPFLKILSNGEKNVLFLAGENNLGKRIVTPLLKDPSTSNSDGASDFNMPTIYRNGKITLAVAKDRSVIELEDGLGNSYSCSETPFYRFQWRGFSMTPAAMFFQAKD